MKNKKIISIVSIVLAVLIIFMSVGYAFFTESLTINGVASTVEYYEGEKLPTQPVIRDTSNNRYFTANDSKEFIDFSSESWVDDTYYLTFVKKIGIVVGSKSITYTVTLINPTTTNYTNGTIKTEITKNPFSRIEGVSGSLSKTTVKPGESVDVSFTVQFDFLTELYTHEVKATITYTYQNKPRYFYFFIKYTN